jgi:uncharacterized membrane protein YfcA
MDIIFLLIGLIILFASFTQGFSGFGFQLVALSLLSLLIDLKHAIPLCALFGLIINIYLIIHYKEHLDFRDLKSVLIGSVLGIPAGVYFLAEADSGIIKTILGIVLIIFVLMNLTNIFKASGINKSWGYLFGVLSGLLGGAFNTNGPPVLVYFYLQNWDKLKLKASLTGFFLISTILIIAGHAISGVTTSAVLIDFLKFLPFVLLGQFFGVRLFGKVSSVFYGKFILIFLLLVSLFMIFG